MTRVTWSAAVAVTMMVLVMSSSGVQGQSIQSQFDQIWATNEQDLVQDVQSLANQLWGWVCPDCAQPTSPSEQHNHSLDHDLVFNVNDNIAEAVQGIASGMGEVSRLYFVDEITSSINGQPANDYWAQLMKGNFQEMQVAFTNYYESMTFSSKYSEYVSSGGGGMGFGVQFDCNDQVLLSIGGGVGAGYSGTMTNTTGGSGGGGGMQVTLNGQSISITGGGGGGGVLMTTGNNFIPSWGTTVDGNQIINQQDFFNQLAPIATACFEAGNLYMRASGGGGAGVVVAPPQAPISDDDFNAGGSSSPVLAYGGGFGFQFTYASPSGSGVDPNTDRGLALGTVPTACRAQCQGTPSATYYNCFCPCLKQGYAQVPGAAWAQQIVCNTPQ